MMSLIATARANDVEPVAYFTHCLRYHAELARRPVGFLPWTSRDGSRATAGPFSSAGAPGG